MALIEGLTDGVQQPIKRDADGNLCVVGDLAIDMSGVEIPPPVGGATEAKQDDAIALLGAGLPAALTATGNFKVSIEEGGASGGLTDDELRATPVPISLDGGLPAALTAGGNLKVAVEETAQTGFVPAGTVALSATDSSGRVELPATGTTLVVRNYGAARAYIKLGAVSVTAAATDYPIDPYTYEVFTRDESTETYLAAICATGLTASLTLSTGTGGLAIDTTPAAIGSVAVSAMPASSTATLANVAGSASSVTVLAANSNRKGAVIHNDSTAILYLKFGATASTTSFTYKLNGGETFETAMPVVYTGIIDGIWASATGAARVTELT